MKFLFITFIFLTLFVCIEAVKKIFHLKGDVPRKIIHISSGVLISFLPYYLSRTEGVVLAIVFALVLLVTKHSGFFSSIHAVERHTLGEIYFPLSVGLCAVLFLPDEIRLFQFGVLVLALSDGLAALVGEKWGRHKIRILGNTKSFEGSAMFFISTYILTCFFFPPAYPLLFLVPLIPALLLTLLELVLVFGLDNLFLPLAAAYLLKFLSF